MKVSGVGIVGAKDKTWLGSALSHRAHAAEGVLFRRVLDLAATRAAYAGEPFRTETLDGLTKIELGAQSATLKKKLNGLGRTISPPWRTDEKQAATCRVVGSSRQEIVLRR